MHVEIQVKKAHLALWRKERGTTEIDCQTLFNHDWSSTAHKFAVQGQLEPPPILSSLTERAQRTLLLGTIVVLWNYISLQKLPFVF